MAPGTSGYFLFLKPAWPPVRRDPSEYRVRRTLRDTAHAFYASALVDARDSLLFPINSFHGADLETQSALDAGFGVHLEPEQIGAAFRGAAFIQDMGFVLFAKVP